MTYFHGWTVISWTEEISRASGVTLMNRISIRAKDARRSKDNARRAWRNRFKGKKWEQQARRGICRVYGLKVDW